MTFKKIWVVLFLIFFLFPICKVHGETSNAGFIPANIWYSKDPFQEGDKIKIYTLIFNPDQREFSGTVIFFDKTVFLGKKNFVVPAKGVKDISVDWTVTIGDHIIFGKIENAKFLISKDKYEEAYLAKDETGQSKFTVSKKIIPKEAPDAGVNPELNTTSPSQIEKIKDIIIEKTPIFIAKPIANTANAVEKFRENTGTASENKKQEVKVEIKALEENKSEILKSFKYAELFALTLASAVFNNKLLFYGILIIGIFLLFRWFWLKIF